MCSTGRAMQGSSTQAAVAAAGTVRRGGCMRMVQTPTPPHLALRWRRRRRRQKRHLQQMATCSTPGPCCHIRPQCRQSTGLGGRSVRLRALWDRSQVCVGGNVWSRGAKLIHNRHAQSYKPQPFISICLHTGMQVYVPFFTFLKDIIATSALSPALCTYTHMQRAASCLHSA